MAHQRHQDALRFHHHYRYERRVRQERQQCRRRRRYRDAFHLLRLLQHRLHAALVRLPDRDIALPSALTRNVGCVHYGLCCWHAQPVPQSSCAGGSGVALLLPLCRLLDLSCCYHVIPVP
jgi:hypothetical protein